MKCKNMKCKNMKCKNMNYENKNEFIKSHTPCVSFIHFFKIFTSHFL